MPQVYNGSTKRAITVNSYLKVTHTLHISKLITIFESYNFPGWARKLSNPKYGYWEDAQPENWHDSKFAVKKAADFASHRFPISSRKYCISYLTGFPLPSSHSCKYSIVHMNVFLPFWSFLLIKHKRTLPEISKN